MIDIKSQNDALLMKFLENFFNHADVPWVTLTWSKFYSNPQTPPQARCPIGSFWWKEVLKLFDKYQSLASCIRNKGNTVMFWYDVWLDKALKVRFPQLFSFSKKHKCSISYFLDQDVPRLFSLPLSTQAIDQLQEIDNLLQARYQDENVEDILTYSWGSTKYSSKKAYNILIGTTAASPLFKWIWASSNLSKHKFFFWLLLREVRHKEPSEKEEHASRLLQLCPLQLGL